MVEANGNSGSTPSICIIGAGFSGMTAGIQLKRKLNISSFTIYDENHEVGGTWLVNTYPGCACDVPSHFYSWSFELNPNWSKSYSAQDEIWSYMMATASKYNLYPHIKFNTQVKTLRWNESIQKWKVTLLDKETGVEESKLYDVVINGPGILRLPNYPKQFEAFQGQILHSAEWDSTVDLMGKVVGIVGSGASAIQIIPNISSQVKELHCYQRKPAWVTTKGQYSLPGLARWAFRSLPFVMWFYRCWIFLSSELFHWALVDKSYASKLGTKDFLKFIKDEVPDPDKQKKLVPNYPLGCKRITFASDYYPALSQQHVHLYTDKITEVTADSIVTSDGKATKLDVLILATGFKVQNYFEPMEVFGKGATDMMALWKSEGPKLLYGIVGSKLPNHFILLGPNTGLGHSSVVFIIECQVNYALDVIGEMIRRNAKSVSVKPAVEDQFMDQLERRMKKMVWGNEQCGSWYADPRGVITALWPWNSTTYWNWTRKVDFSQFDFYKY